MLCSINQLEYSLCKQFSDSQPKFLKIKKLKNYLISKVGKIGEVLMHFDEASLV